MCINKTSANNENLIFKTIHNFHSSRKDEEESLSYELSFARPQDVCHC